MVHMPKVYPGDYVSWHCDTVHAFDGVHTGSSDSSVLYIPTCPLTINNARSLAKQREALTYGWPCPDLVVVSARVSMLGVWVCGILRRTVR